jgi:hypothetical protein
MEMYICIYEVLGKGENGILFPCRDVLASEFTKYTPKFYIFIDTLGSAIILSEGSSVQHIMHLFPCDSEMISQPDNWMPYQLRLVLGEGPGGSRIDVLLAFCKAYS